MQKRMILVAVLAILAVFLIAFGVFKFVNFKTAIDVNNDVADYQWSSRIIPKEYATKELDGSTYNYRSGIINVLLLGVDTQGEMAENKISWASGQCDAIYLMVLDKINATVNIIQFDRDTMTEINVLGMTGDHVGVEVDHLCLSFAYGNGQDTSCENACSAVSSLLGGIPIDYYACMNISAIEPLVDAIGGVTVTCVSDLTSLDPALAEGATVTLNGEQSELYVRSRKEVDDGTNSSRLLRQKSFVEALLSTILDKVSDDVTDATDWYNAVKPYTYLSTSFENFLSIFEMAMSYSRSAMITPEGTYDYTKTYAEFYIDQSQLNQTVLQLWYK